MNMITVTVQLTPQDREVLLSMLKHNCICIEKPTLWDSKTLTLGTLYVCIDSKKGTYMQTLKFCRPYSTE